MFYSNRKSVPRLTARVYRVMHPAMRARAYLPRNVFIMGGSLSAAVFVVAVTP